MDRQILAEKLESLRRCLSRLAEKCPDTPQALERDVDLQDILSLNLTRAVQMCVDIGAHGIAALDVSPPHAMGETFAVLAGSEVIPESLALKMKKAVGFRNIAVHSYDDIDLTIVHTLATKHLDDFTEFAAAISSRYLS